MVSEIEKEIEAHIKAIRGVDAAGIEKAAEVIVECLKGGGKVVLFGNGGSAADAQHIAAELSGKFRLERKGLPAIALTTNTSSLTAIGNDYGFESVFERQVEGLVDGKDAVIGISTSGKSENVLRGMKKAKELGAKTIALSGSNGFDADVCIKVPGDTPRVQEGHIMIGHIICGMVEGKIFGNE